MVGLLSRHALSSAARGVGGVALMDEQSIQLAAPANDAMQQAAKYINSIDNAESVRKCIDDMAILEAYVKRAREYSELAAKYIHLECDMWCKIADLCDDADLRKEVIHILTRAENNILLWVRKKDAKGREQIHIDADRGRTIKAQRRDDIACQNMCEKFNVYQDAAKRLLDEYDNHGKVALTVATFTDKIDGRHKIDNQTVSAYIRDTRNKLLKRGAVSGGDGSGTYFNPKNANRRDVRDAIDNRIAEVLQDIENIRMLCEECGGFVFLSEVDKMREAVNALVPIATSEPDWRVA